MQILDRIRRTIRRHDLAGPDTRLVVAVSGGSDSVALACLLNELAAAGDLRVVGIAHFNHQLRREAAADEALSVALASRLGIACLADREDVAARARRERRSLEDAARTARHAFLERARRHFGADRVALGHTRDDQAETFLLRLVRGAGARGLAAMHPRRGDVIRPLIDCRRADLRAWLDRRGIPFVHDPSNADVSIPRNRVRAELLPLLEARFNPRIVDALADASDLAREDWRWMEAEADAAAAGLCRREPGVWYLDAAALARYPVALARLLLARVLTEASGGRPLSFEHVDAALRLSVEGGPPAAAPGLRLEREGPQLVLREGRRDIAAPSFRYRLPVPGEVHLPEAGCALTAEVADSVAGAGVGVIPGKGAVALVRQDRFEGPLAVRNRRPGDVFRPLGLSGRKKLQDFFVDRKVARRGRDLVPLVVDRTDKIVWVAGHAIDEEFRVTDPAQAVLILRLKQV
jgi:tRNA(Ile)-lysidine synthase